MSEIRTDAWKSSDGTEEYYKCRAWANFNGTGTPYIHSSGNVSSITDLGTGHYRINWSIALPDTNFALTITPNDDDGVYATYAYETGAFHAKRTTTSAEVYLYGSAGVRDASNISVAVFR